jgi:YD repeat-containing protein
LDVGDGTSLWFASAGGGSYTRPAGDFSTLSGNGSSFTRTLTDGTQMQFDATGRETAEVDRNGLATTYGYNAGGNLTSVTDPYGQAMRLAYLNGQVSTITDPASRVTQIGYDGSGRLDQITDPDNAVWQYSLDGSNLLTSETDPRNNLTTFTFNFGRVLGANEAGLTREALAPEQLIGISGGAAQLLVNAPATYTDGNSNLWQAQTDGLGFGAVEQQADPLSDTTVTYRDANALGWLNSDPLFRRDRAFFDGKGNTTKTVFADDAGESFAYNNFSEVTQYTDPDNHSTNYGFDGHGNLTSVTDAAGKTTTYSNNAHGLPTSVTDPLTHTRTFGYDSLDRLTSETDAYGHAATISYNSAGDVLSRTDERNFTTTYSYDNAGRLKTEQTPDGPAGSHPLWQYNYDA